jgi:hypothetical protein
MIENYEIIFFFSHNLVSILIFDHHSASTTTSEKPPSSSDNVENHWNLITKMRDLRARSPYALFIKDNYREISAKHPGRIIFIMIRNGLLIR